MRFPRDGRHFAAAVILWFRSLKKINRIAVCVTLVHIFVLFGMTIDHWITGQPNKHRPIVIRTIQPLKAPTLAQSATPSPLKQSSTISSTPPIQQPKKQVSTITARKKESRHIKKSSKENKTIPQNTLQEIEKSLNALSHPQIVKTQSQKPELLIPSIVKTNSSLRASIEPPDQPTVATTYHLSLIEILQSSLQLPEVGPVRLKISLQAPGTIVSIQILEAKSEKNAHWLKEQLPLLDLPNFNDFGIVDGDLEFTITFTNAETT